MPAERAPYGGGQGGEGGEEAAGGGADARRQGQDGRTAAVKQCGQGRFDAPRTNEFTLSNGRPRLAPHRRSDPAGCRALVS